MICFFLKINPEEKKTHTKVLEVMTVVVIIMSAKSTNRKRQEDEITVISSIYDKLEFFYSLKDEIECTRYVFPVVEGSLHLTCREFLIPTYSIKNLPPSKLCISLPKEYPSLERPDYSLKIPWLAPWETSLICQKLDQLWMENYGNEILYLWFEFLSSEILNYLDITNTLDVSFLYTVHTLPLEYLQSKIKELSDPRAGNYALFLNPIEFLLSYDKDQNQIQFVGQSYTCTICLEEFTGGKCYQIETCKHVYCKHCIRTYVTVKIDESICTVDCPELDCRQIIESAQIKEICPRLYSKYENLLLQVTLKTMKDVIVCPRTFCQQPVIRDSDDNLAICPNCEYSFCVYCLKLYHGIAPCDMSTDENVQLVEEYCRANYREKQALQKKYGRKQIQIVVEKYLTKEYLKENTKPCPNCQTTTSKIDGCNKIVCSYCQASFCWLCGLQITAANAYDHFTIDSNKSCVGRLFEGVLLDNDPDFDREEIFDNIAWFADN